MTLAIPNRLTIRAIYLYISRCTERNSLPKTHRILQAHPWCGSTTPASTRLLSKIDFAALFDWFPTGLPTGSCVICRDFTATHFFHDIPCDNVGNPNCASGTPRANPTNSMRFRGMPWDPAGIHANITAGLHGNSRGTSHVLPRHAPRGANLIIVRISLA